MRPRTRDLGIKIGRLEPGIWNAITDVPAVRVGHTTIIQGQGRLIPGEGPIRTGVTAILPHDGDLFADKVTGAVHRINGFGEVTNCETVHELGVIEGPILLTNSFSVASVADAVIDWSLEHSRAVGIDSWGINPVVAETNDYSLNDIRGRHVHRDHVFHAINSATAGPVEEGSVGGGTGMICYDFKGGIGTASRKLPDRLNGYTIGVLAQTNFGWRPQLLVDGVPVGRELECSHPMNYSEDEDAPRHVDGGSVLVVIATDAPCSHRQLMRMAVRAQNGLARTGSHTGNTSGDFVIAFSSSRRKPHFCDGLTCDVTQIIESGDLVDHVFWSVVEATEEAVLNSLFKADTMVGRDNHTVPGLPIRETVEIMHRYGHTEVHLP
jgi:D-aminopeptidase